MTKNIKRIIEKLNDDMQNESGEFPELMCRTSGNYSDIVWLVDGLTIMDSENNPDMNPDQLENLIVLALRRELRALQSAVDRLSSIAITLAEDDEPHAAVNPDDTVTIHSERLTVKELKELVNRAERIIESGENKRLQR